MAECEFINKLDHDGWNCPNCRDEYRAKKIDAFEELRRLYNHSSHCDDAACLGCECDDYDGEVTDLHCEPHGWWLEEDEQCPVCEGIEIERKRIIGLLDNYTMYRFEKQWLIDMIEETE